MIAKIKGENPALSHRDAIKKVSMMWSEMTEDQKTIYKSKSEADHARF